MKTTPKAFIAFAMLVPAMACADRESENAAEITDVEKSPIDYIKSDGATHEYSISNFILECSMGFKELKANAINMDGMEMITETEDQIAYMSGPISFTFTKEAHAAHPVIMRRDIVFLDEKVESVDMAACGYGSKEEFDEMIEIFDFFNQQYLLQQKFNINPGENSEIRTEPDDTPEIQIMRPDEE